MNNLAKLNITFQKNFNPEAFSGNILHLTKPLLIKEYKDSPQKAGIPLMDIFFYGYQRIKDMGADYSHLRSVIEERLNDLVVNTNVAFETVTICTIPSPDTPCNDYQPTVMELFYSNLAADKPAGHYSDLQSLEYTVNRGVKGKGLDLRNSLPLAISALKLAGGKASNCQFMDESTLRRGITFLFEREGDKLLENVTLHLIDSATDLNIPLSELKLRNKISLSDFYKYISPGFLGDKYSAASQKQVAMQLVNEHVDEINHDFDPNAYFNF